MENFGFTDISRKLSVLLSNLPSCGGRKVAPSETLDRLVLEDDAASYGTKSAILPREYSPRDIFTIDNNICAIYITPCNFAAQHHQRAH